MPEETIMVCHGDRAPYPQLPLPAEQMYMLGHGSISLSARNGFKRPALGLDGLLRDLQAAGFAESYPDRTSEEAHTVVGAIETATGVGLTVTPFNLELLTKRLIDYDATVALACYPKNYVGTLAGYVGGLKKDIDYLAKELDRKQKALEVVMAERDAAEAKCDEFERKSLKSQCAWFGSASYAPGIESGIQHGENAVVSLQPYKPLPNYRFLVAVKKADVWELIPASCAPMNQGDARHKLHNAARAYGVDRVKLLEVVPVKCDLTFTI